jgi:hypothetical protein
VPDGASIDPATGVFSWTPDESQGPGEYTFDVVVSDGSLSDSETITVTVNNVAPTLTAAANHAANEGSITSFELGSFSDPGHGDAPWGVDVDWGDGSTHSTFDASDQGDLANASHKYDDNGSYTVTVTVTDKDGATDSASFGVTVANVAPSASFVATSPVNEGSASILSLDNPLDPSAADTAAGFHYTFACNGDAASLAATYAAASTSSTSACTFPDGPSSHLVRSRIFDDDGSSTDYSVTVVVNNVAPTIGGSTFTVNPVSGLVSASVSWTDPGADTETVKFEYFRGTSKVGETTFANQTQTGLANDMTTRIGSGCGRLSMVVTVTDDDGGTTSATQTSGVSDVYTLAFQAPIKANERNIAKYGNVVPIKVSITSSCNGAAIISEKLVITVAPGTALDDDAVDDTPNLVAESVSSADTGNVMRISGNGYIYNFSTKQLKAGQDYTIRIRLNTSDGVIVAKALFQPKK